MAKVLRWIHHLEDGFLILALLSMLGMAVLQIALRNFFDGGIFWAESFLRILVLWVAMLGAMVATRESSHINIDLLSRYLDPRLMRWIQLVSNLFAAGICSVVAYTAIEYVRFEYEDQTIAFAMVPTWVCQAIIPFGFGVMALRFVINGILGVLPRKIVEVADA